jgi:adenosine deaminase
VEYLAESGIPLEVCPTSNIKLGLFSGVDTHPLRRLYDAGVVVTINSDDPPLFNTTLNQEVALLHSGFGFDVDTIDEIVLNGVRYSCLPQERKDAMLRQFQGEMAALRAEHLGVSKG